MRDGFHNEYCIDQASWKRNFVVVFKIRPRHEFKRACILQYDALDSRLSAQAYSNITSITNANIGTETIFGCSNSIYDYDPCKFSWSSNPAEVRQIKLVTTMYYLEDQLKSVIDKVADLIALKHKVLAPDFYNNKLVVKLVQRMSCLIAMSLQSLTSSPTCKKTSLINLGLYNNYNAYLVGIETGFQWTQSYWEREWWG